MFGGLVINCVCYGTSMILDDRSWQIPLYLFYVVPTIIAAGIWFVPESPRWLMRQGRFEEAQTSLRRLRQGPFSEEQIEAEFAELKNALEKEVDKGRWMEIWNAKN